MTRERERNREFIAFRLALVVAGGVLIVCASMAVLHHIWAVEADRSGTYRYAEMQRLEKECKASTLGFMCEREWQERNRENLLGDWEERSEHKRLRRIYWQVATSIPVLILLTFYLIRWIVAGRLTPVWPLRTSGP